MSKRIIETTSENNPPARRTIANVDEIISLMPSSSNNQRMVKI